MERLLSNFDWHSAGLTLAAILALFLIYSALVGVYIAIRDFFRSFRLIRLCVSELERQVKIINRDLARLDFHRMSVPPPLPLRPATIDATDWVDDEKKTESLADPCLPSSRP